MQRLIPVPSMSYCLRVQRFLANKREAYNKMKMMFFKIISFACRRLPIPGKVLNFIIPTTFSTDWANCSEIVKSRWGEARFNIVNLNDLIQRQIFLQGYFEYFESKKLRKHLKPGMIYVDVGTNIGWHLLNASYLVGPKGKVVGFEPSKNIYATLQRNINLNQNNNISTYNIAVGDKDEVLELVRIDHGNDGASTLHPKKGVNFDHDDKELVEVRHGNNLFDALNLRHIDLLKVDVEGHEISVLKGLSSILQSGRVQSIMIELNEEALNQAGYTGKDLLILLESHHYQCKCIKTNTLIGSVSTHIPELVNLFCTLQAHE